MMGCLGVTERYSRKKLSSLLVFVSPWGLTGIPICGISCLKMIVVLGKVAFMRNISGCLE